MDFVKILIGVHSPFEKKKKTDNFFFTVLHIQKWLLVKAKVVSFLEQEKVGQKWYSVDSRKKKPQNGKKDPLRNSQRPP